MEMMVRYPVHRIGTMNYDIQGNLDAFAASDASVMTIEVPKRDRSKVKARWKSAIQRSRRGYIVETVPIGIQVKRY